MDALQHYFLTFHSLESPIATPGLHCKRGDKVPLQPSSSQPLPCHCRVCLLSPCSESHALSFLFTLCHESHAKGSAERNNFCSIHFF